MKKLICICLCLLALAGCSKNQEVKTEPLNFSGFDAVVTTEFNGITLTSAINYDVAVGYRFSFTSPKTLENITVIGTDGELVLSGEKLSLSLANNKMPKGMLCRAVCDCVNAVSGAYPVKTENGISEYAYNVEGTACVLYTDENNNFLRLVVGPREFIFDNFSYNH